MTQINMPNGGISNMDEHEVTAFPNNPATPDPAPPTLQDLTTVKSYLVVIKLDMLAPFQ